MTIAHITRTNGAAAVFMRGFMDAYLGGETLLRKCQEAGHNAILELGGTELSVSYISKMSRTLKESGVISTKKGQGRKYVVGPGDNTDAFQGWLSENELWGTDLETTPEEFKEKVDVLTTVWKRGGVLIRWDNPLSGPSYKKLMERFKKGELVMAFIEADLPVGVKKDGKTKLLREVSHDGKA